MLTGLLLATVASLALAQSPPAAGDAGTVGSDRFVAGASVSERAPIGGDLLAAGGSVDVYAAVDGDAVVAGGTVRLDSAVTQSVYAAGGRVTVLGSVGHNARLAGGQIQLEPSAQIAGNLTVTGGQIELRGTIDGSVGAAGADVLIDAKIGGDVEIAARSLALGPNARIDGNLRYRSGDVLQRDPAAQVSGTVTRLGADSAGLVADADDGESIGWIGTGLLVLWTIGLTLLAAIAVALLPRATASLSRALHQQPGWGLLLGFFVLVCTPIGVLMAFVTVIGIPLGILLLLIYLMLMPVAWIATAIGIGDWFVARLPSAQPDRVAPRVVAAALAVVLLAFLTQVPWVGEWIAIVVLMAGLGALALQLQRLVPR